MPGACSKSSCGLKSKSGGGGRLLGGMHRSGARSSSKKGIAQPSRGLARVSGAYRRNELTSSMASGGVRGRKTCSRAAGGGCGAGDRRAVGGRGGRRAARLCPRVRLDLRELVLRVVLVHRLDLVERRRAQHLDARPTLATAGDAQMRLWPAHLTRAPPPRHGPTKARREEVQAAIESLPASSWALKRSLACRPSPSLCRRRDHEPSAQFRLPPPLPCLQAVPRWREEARRAIGDVPASSCPPKRSHRPVAPPSAPPRAATVRPPGLAYTG